MTFGSYDLGDTYVLEVKGVATKVAPADWNLERW